MRGFKSGDYDRKINRFFIILAIVLALLLGVGLCIPALMKAGPMFLN